MKTFKEFFELMVSASPYAIEPMFINAGSSLEAKQETAAPEPSEEDERQSALMRVAGAMVDTVTRTGFVQVRGVIEPGENAFYDWFGVAYTSLGRVERQLNALAQSDDCDRIVMVFHSPGGSVFGVSECAETIRRVSEVKPVIGYVGYMAASAAYHLASQCDEIIAAPSALIGSIGAFITHFDYSRMLEEDGITVTLIAQPEDKVSGNPYEPLSDRARDNYERIVRAAYDQFVSDVLVKRTVDISDKPNEYAVMSTAENAVSLGMIDRIERFDDFMTDFATPADLAATRRAQLTVLQLKRKIRA